MTFSKSPKRSASTSRQQQELRNAHAALADQLAEERREHEKDVAEANATIRDLHSALSQTRYKLDVVEREQANRVHDVIKSLESLRSKLKHQEETKKAADARASQLSVLVQELRSQTSALQHSLQKRDVQISNLKSEKESLSQQLDRSQADVHAAENRIEDLNKKVTGMTDDLSAAARSSDTLQSQLQESNERARRSEQTMANQLEEIQAVKAKLIKVGGEEAHLKHLLTIEKAQHNRARQDLEEARVENKDLISQKSQLTAAAASVDELQCKYDKLQAEHTAVEAALASRAHEAECLAAENKRLASDWKLREDGLTDSHEIRIEHLMNTLKERERQNCDLHNQLHRSNVAMESLKAEVTTSREEAKKSSEAVKSSKVTQAKLSEQLQEMAATLDSRDMQISALKRDAASKSLQFEGDLERAQAACTEVRQQAESLRVQVREQADSMSEMKASQADLEQSHADQVSNMKASLSELGLKLAESHSQQCQAAARSETTISGLNEKLSKASAEVAVLRSTVEAAALEQERAEGEMKQLQHDLDSRSRDLQQTKLELARQTEESKLHQERLQQLEAQYSEQFKRQDRALKDIAAAMHQEEQAKLAAEKGLQSAKERTVTLEDDVRGLTRKLEDAHNRCKEAEMDRDEFQHKIKRLEALRQRDRSEQRSMSRSKSTGRAYETWLRKSSQALGSGLGSQVEGISYSTPGGLRFKAPAEERYQPELLPAEHAPEQLQLSSYHQRLAEIRSRDIL